MLTYRSVETISVDLRLYDDGGVMDLSYSGRQQSLDLVSSPRQFGGLQWYVVCPQTGRRVRVLFRPSGASSFASRHAWGRSAAYASQFLDPVDRVWRTKDKIKARLLGNEDPEKWDLPPKPKGMRWTTYERWEAKYDKADEALIRRCELGIERLMKSL
jgi:hypothetical protein